MKRMVLAFALIAAAQAQKLAFEVALVKLNSSNTTGGYVRPAGERLTVSNISLKGLILYSYRAGSDTPYLSNQVYGGPDWMEKDRFDIEAKAETTGKAVSQDQMRLMVQTLLEDRFKLKVHRETRELPVYNMVLEKNGPKMKLSGDQTPQLHRRMHLVVLL